MDNKIHINPDEIRNLPDDSIDDCETIRQIALLNDSTLYCKIKKGFEFYGLYPHVMNTFDVSLNDLKEIEKYLFKERKI